ncbi:MAG: hypothetical protein AAFR97_12560 [Bacteroidota bacterium]
MHKLTPPREYIQEAVIDTKAPMSENGRLQFDGVMSATLHNAGDTIVTINGHLTMKPGATVQLASPHQFVVFNCSLRIAFATPEAEEQNRLEVMECRLASITFNNFTRDDPADQPIGI